MTVIAYRDGVLAADTLSLAGWDRAGEVVKIRKVGGVLAAMVGGTAVGQRFLDWAVEGAGGRPPAMWVGDAEAEQATGYLFLPDGMLVRFHPKVPPSSERGPFYAFGSGGWMATGALAQGATAAEAVEVAIRYNAGCGGRVMTLTHR